MGFPKDFVWGVASSAHQVEGSWPGDGKGRSVWDAFEQQEGRVCQGHTAKSACDFYHRYPEDIRSMEEMGVKAYRFSVDWSRILPEGTGKINEKGIAFYDNLIDQLLEAGIEPYMTLFHWELPCELHKRGGWMNREIAEWFGAYAEIIVRHFGDRVKHFFTLNEPQCFIGLGYLRGDHAPGLTASLEDTIVMSHNVLRAHGAAVEKIREFGRTDACVGYAPTAGVCYPKSERPEDIEAARRMFFAVPGDEKKWSWNVSWWSDPVILGHYPEDGLCQYGQYLPKEYEKDLEFISQEIDIYGQNIYNGRCIYMGQDEMPLDEKRYSGFPQTAAGWPVTPECLYWGPKFLYERYKKPIYITENGMACADVVSLDGCVHDPQRIDFLQRYLQCLKRAAEEIDLRGYFQWTLTDNFEWAMGYTLRFGLIYTDFCTQERNWKDSAYWYRNIIRRNGEQL